ncbi:MAG TPA: hypothetical protein VNS32_13045 [Flavisolibacter sp.]|nr:hypothetical protein [Flavisolibacter sp.]
MKTFYFLVLSVALFSCKKEVEEVKQNKLLDVITNGTWKITNYMKGSTDVTADFSTYQFQFKDNNTVDAQMNGTVVKTGQWNGDINAQTVTANFDNPGYPLELLNGVWNIMGGDTKTVLAKQTINGETRSLKLEKQ